VPSDLDHRTFVAHDIDGARYRIVAARRRGRVQATDSPEPWSYRTLDGRVVRPADCFHLYEIEPDGIRLTTSDPDEPTD
jgi:hypothetical protein